MEGSVSEFLTVRLSSQKEADIPWLVWSAEQQEVIASGQVAGWEALHEIESYADQRSVVVLLAASDLILTSVEIPPGASRQLENMLPYLLEDEIAQDVEDVHFCVLSKGRETADVVGVERLWLRACLDHLKSCGFDVKRVLPDVLAIPRPEHGLAALQLGDEWLVRKSTTQGMAVDAQWLSLLAASDWVQNEGEYLPLQALTPLPELSLAETQEWRYEPSGLVMQLLTQEALTSKFNLLTGSFKLKSSWLRYWQIWRKVAIAAGLFVAVSISYSLFQAHQYEAQADAYRAESERIFRSIFPDKQKIPTVTYLKRQMSDEMARLSGGASVGSVLKWLSPLPEALKGINLQLQSIKFDSNRSEIRLEATSRDFQSFEQARTQLEQYFAVEQGQLNKNGEQVFGVFVVKPK
ncbi:type II secretion system protein GspL [Vibrio cholerae]|nr:type II secretion system protein GspL [Vibrio cholerae]EGR0285629.1 type II secretion system protein GspL [Vibrio cholerae]EGR0420018.1 type II secretion system protein GspL [Vibrio cholerae]EGR0440925.1 type II secretion system protein GspL [Vibrio cholerae]EGR0449740.1 type II secretion system protein GspL [Vibrio cholerae]EGR1021664.1 type II secretion system protein GspL [Vibrio cholerae]